LFPVLRYWRDIGASAVPVTVLRPAESGIMLVAIQTCDPFEDFSHA